MTRRASLPYAARKRDGVRLLIHREWEEEDLLQMLTSEAQGLRRNPCCEAVPTCKGSSVFKIRRPKGDLYLKCFQGGGWAERAKSVFRGTKAERSWKGGNLLQRSGFSTPPLIGLGRGSFLLTPFSDFLLTEAVGGPRLKHFLLDGFEDRLAQRGWRKREFLAMLARTIAELHRRGIYHGDLNPTNILVCLEGELSPSTFCFLDNARCRLRRKVPYALRIRDLAGLNYPRIPALSDRDRLRFFALYQRYLGTRDPREMMGLIWGRSTRPRKRRRPKS